ncbi:FH protein interacting protein FIP2 [Aphelenchoides fujianensis]|nr:FH protein interacting protein FIP2 [Aphelenchoides fujianensis]
MKHHDDIMTINVGGKKYTVGSELSRISGGVLSKVRRSDLLADPRSRLADWFRPNNNRPLATDKGGNVYLNRDPKTFRHILAYLRLKKERFVATLALPSKPDDLAKLIGECEALNLAELKDCAVEMLQTYQRREEQHYVTSYVQAAMKDYEAWQFEKDQVHKQNGRQSPPQNDILSSAYDEWENM